MTLLECQERMTHREYLVWMAHFELEREHPSRADLYAMQIAAEVRRSWVKDARSVDANDFLLKFKGGPAEKPREKELDENWLEKSKSLWAGLVGLKRKKQE